MKTLLFLIAIGCLVLIPFVTSEYVDYFENYKVIDTNHPENCYKEETEVYRDECFIIQAAYHKEEKFCELIKGNDPTCYHMLAVYTGNQIYCNLTGIYYESCKTEVKAINTNNPSLCDSTGNPDYCYGFVSLALEDWDLCYKSQFVNQCFLNIVVKKKNIQLCKEIKNSFKNTFCYNYFAILEKNPAYCDLADEPEECFYMTALNLKNATLCEKAGVDKYDCSEYVEVALAVDKGNPDACESLDTEFNQGRCYDEYALKLDDPTLCDKSYVPSICKVEIERRKQAIAEMPDFSKFNINKSKSLPIWIIIISFVIITLFICAVLFFRKK